MTNSWVGADVTFRNKSICGAATEVSENEEEIEGQTGGELQDFSTALQSRKDFLLKCEEGD